MSGFEIEDIMNKSVQQKREECVVDYAEWFAHTYTHIQASGGDPILFIERLPSSIIDTMVRNHLYIMYNGPSEGI